MFSKNMFHFLSGYIFTCPRSFKSGAHNEMQLRRFGNLDAGNLIVKVMYQDFQSPNETLAAERKYDIPEGKSFFLLLLFDFSFEQFLLPTC